MGKQKYKVHKETVQYTSVVRNSSDEVAEVEELELSMPEFKDHADSADISATGFFFQCLQGHRCRVQFIFKNSLSS